MEDLLIEAQKGEITEALTYEALAKMCKNPKNKKILEKIAQDERRHYGIIKGLTKKEVEGNKVKVLLYTALAKVFGLSFTLLLMEKNETNAQQLYSTLAERYKKIAEILKDEERHEMELIKMIEEEKLTYIGDIVLGLNDALVEFTGTLAGLTLAIANNTIIAITGIIMGIAASLSMAASNYLSAREEENKHPKKAAAYTGLAYLFTVIFLVLPYVVVQQPLLSLFLMLVTAVIIIALYNFYVATVKNQPFMRRFAEMVSLSLGIAAVSFFIGLFIRRMLGEEV